MRQARRQLHHCSAVAPQRYVYCARYLLTRSSYKTLATPLPDLPLDEFKVCAITTPFDLQIIPSVIAAVFSELLRAPRLPSVPQLTVSDISAFLLILWFAYSNAVNLRLPVLLRTIVADATVYFIVAACVHAAVLLFLVLGDVSRRPLSTLMLLIHSSSELDQ